jgi:hypothetical protein
MAIYTTPDLYDQFLKHLSSTFKFTEQGDLKEYLSIKYERNELNSSMTASQESMAENILETINMKSCKPVSTPMMPGTTIKRNTDSPLDESEKKLYLTVVGKLNWMAIWTRPDLAFTLSQLSKALANPGSEHMIALKHAVRYIQATKKYSVNYGGQAAMEAKQRYGKDQIYAFADASFMSDPETCCGTTGYVIFLNGTPVAWRSRTQTTVAKSTAEAEYMSASRAVHEIIYLRRFLNALGFPQNGPTNLMEDSTACIAICNNSAHRERTKHIDVHKYFARQHVQDGTVKMVHCPTSEQLADAFTKSLPKDTIKRLTMRILGQSQGQC